MASPPPLLLTRLVTSSSFLCLLGSSIFHPGVAADAGMPTFIFHGMGVDSSFEDDEVELLSKKLPGWSFHSLEYAGAAKANTILWSLQKQSETGCRLVQEHPSFQNATEISLIGHSNGGIVARWILQNCFLGTKTVAYFISVGGPQRGITKLPVDGVPSWLRPSLDWIICTQHRVIWTSNA